MAEEDEIDILGDFSFNSCFAQNNQGIEDTVHPQWLLDSTETNWYDKNKDKNIKDGPYRKLLGNSSSRKYNNNTHTEWSKNERQILVMEMAKFGRNIKKISQTLKTKTEAEIQAMIEAEFGVMLESSLPGLEKNEEQYDMPTVAQEEIVTAELNTRSASADKTKQNKNKNYRKKYPKSKNIILKPNLTNEMKPGIESSEIIYEDDLIVGSTESIGSDLELTDIVSKNVAKHQAKGKVERKIGNHRRKVSRNYDKKPRNKSKELKSPQGRQRKNSSLSDDSVKSPKMQLLLGSGQALPISEGEQVIKIEKKKDSEPESDIDIDVDSDSEAKQKKPKTITKDDDAPIVVPLENFEPMPRRQKKINLGGGGGYTIMHTEAGDLYRVQAEPRRERAPRRPPIHLMQCRVYSAERPAPFEVELHVSALLAMDAHAHSSRAEVMGLVGGHVRGRVLAVTAYRPTAAAAGATHCEMDPVSQVMAAESLCAAGAAACGWHHSHPASAARPSARDLRTQRALQRALRRPFLALITSPHWPPGRTASHYRCIRVEDDAPSDADADLPAGYQFSVSLVPDLNLNNLDSFLAELSAIRAEEKTDMSVDMACDVCPHARMPILDKLISSVSHHVRAAGYRHDDPLVPLLLHGIRDVFR
ncbi:histone H2A deubiquitinase MYSM1 isoform X3 [Bombyx mori]|uniref:MPN domain-containing protein n=1 Tax=Bombyx mori TaxID=7091 RepID=A0A8R2DN50_BOMMO|nr:histone H2A deubiquitinase MYSM1 isoform X2 [Bombyx mori]